MGNLKINQLQMGLATAWLSRRFGKTNQLRTEDVDYITQVPDNQVFFLNGENLSVVDALDFEDVNVL